MTGQSAQTVLWTAGVEAPRWQDVCEGRRDPDAGPGEPDQAAEAPGHRSGRHAR
ncbi:MAG: hypothetical protein ACLQDY_29225 [Streptosporangiaceae bacterium]